MVRLRLTIRALEVATVEPVVVNVAGSETASAEEYCVPRRPRDETVG
ncbi:MAG: hypothetical protein ACLPYY_06555 [Acidimicrobiales bacterium]